MSMPNSDTSITAARAMLQDLFDHRPWIYWLDFLITITIGYTAGFFYLNGPLSPAMLFVCFLVAAFALYRLAMFMHEIVHFRKDEMRLFRAVWNISAGIPMLMPSFFYESHIGHHNTHSYGTDEDGEYLPLGNGMLGNILFFFSQIFLQPLFIITRFAIGTPLSLFSPELRKWLLEHASSFVINFKYRRKIPDDAPRHWWALMELGCFLRIMAPVVLLGLGIVDMSRPIKLICLALFVLGLNYVRTLVAHRYIGHGEEMSHEEQLLDSTTITGGWLTELICPVGLRYHALHHLFPRIPYYNLGRAHRRLMEQLPAGSSYHQVVYPTYWAVITELAGNIYRARQQRRLQHDSGTRSAA